MLSEENIFQISAVHMGVCAYMDATLLRASAVPEKSFSGYSKTFTSRFLGVQRRDNLQVILLLGQDGSFLTEPENHI